MADFELLIDLKKWNKFLRHCINGKKRGCAVRNWGVKNIQACVKIQTALPNLTQSQQLISVNNKVLSSLSF